MRLAAQRRPVRRTIAVVLTALLALMTVGVASAQSMPGGITDEARHTHDLYIFILVLATVVFVAVEGFLIFAITRFRKKDDSLPPQIHGSNVLEMVWTGIPVLLVGSIFIFSFITLDRVENKAAPEDLTVEVTGFQWQWQFVYNLNDLGPGSNTEDEGKITILGTPDVEPELVIPTDEVVELKLIGVDVIHSFYVRDFNYKLDVIPGRDNRFTVTAREPGIYQAQCAEYCGTDHAFMRFTVRVVPRAEFDAWVQEQNAASTAARVP